MEQTFAESIAFVVYLLLFIFGVQTAMVDIYEFVLFKDYGNTHRFKKKYKKRPFIKRFFLLSFFDDELVCNCKHKNILKKIVIADIVYWMVGLIVIISRIWFIAIGTTKLNSIYLAYNLLLIIFYFWYLAHSIRWDAWIKGTWKAGKREFQIRLSDGRKSKK
ncbi:MAG: hypothetical protein IIW48_04725 [Clostridia bacterium]|nr:hypothetical protein [Clostridia bacterium]